MNDATPNHPAYHEVPIVMGAYLTCERCRVALYLGQVVWRSRHAGQISHFQGAESIPSSTDQRLSRAVWKMLADHTGHPMRVLLRHQLPETAAEIGGAGPGAVGLEDYLSSFEG